MGLKGHWHDAKESDLERYVEEAEWEAQTPEPVRGQGSGQKRQKLQKYRQIHGQKSTQQVN